MSVDLDFKILSVDYLFICIDIDINIPELDSVNISNNLTEKFRVKLLFLFKLSTKWLHQFSHLVLRACYTDKKHYSSCFQQSQCF